MSMDKGEDLILHMERKDSKDEALAAPKKNKKGMVLVPQPTDNPQDPLNWPTAKKMTTLGIVSLASFAATNQTTANAAGYVPQAELYSHTPVQLSYSVSLAIAGVGIGPLIWNPLAKRYGKCPTVAWGLLLAALMNVWSSAAGIAPTTVGANIIMETFFLHDRGKCFAIWTITALLGTVTGATFSGFIVQTASWTIQFWYNAALQAVIVVLCLIFLDETGWSREGGPQYPTLPTTFFKRRAAIYFFTQRTTPQITMLELGQVALAPILIGLSPIGLLVGVFLCVTFGWAIAVNVDISVFLQTPLEEGGYGFTPYQNAYFTFAFWIGLFATELYGHLVNDRFPLWACSRAGGIWKPEYRLHVVWFPCLIAQPIALGLVGACLQYHLSYVLLAFAVFLQGFGGAAGVSACTSYVVECFTGQANEVAVALTLWRCILGIALPFFLFPWASAVGTNWTFGMMAFFNILVCFGPAALMLWGRQIRGMSRVGTKTEEGVKVFDVSKETATA